MKGLKLIPFSACGVFKNQDFSFAAYYTHYFDSPSDIIRDLLVQRHAEPTRQRLVRRYGGRITCRTQQYHIRNIHTPTIIIKRPSHSQSRPVIRERNDRRRGLCDRYSIIEVQRPRCFAVYPWRYDEIEVELAKCGGRVRAVGAEGNNRATFDVDGDLGEVRVDCDGGAGAAERFVSEEAVELVVGEIDGDTGGTLSRHGRD